MRQNVLLYEFCTDFSFVICSLRAFPRGLFLSSLFKPARRPHNIPSTNCSPSTLGGGGVQPKKPETKPVPYLKFAVAFGFFGFQPPLPSTIPFGYHSYAATTNFGCHSWVANYRTLPFGYYGYVATTVPYYLGYHGYVATTVPWLPSIHS